MSGYSTVLGRACGAEIDADAEVMAPPGCWTSSVAICSSVLARTSSDRPWEWWRSVLIGCGRRLSLQSDVCSSDCLLGDARSWGGRLVLFWLSTTTE